MRRPFTLVVAAFVLVAVGTAAGSRPLPGETTGSRPTRPGSALCRGTVVTMAAAKAARRSRMWP
jgi:hypothetical protein